jgi:flavin reductase (DIM6/NTAB) family NADH-FMN oxidoreductase RutF
MPTAIPPDDRLAAQTKLALRRLASAVAVVTCRDDRTRHAMTATAVNAMSMQPPSMIVCVNRSSSFHAAVSRADSFAINILHRDQVQISMGAAATSVARIVSTRLPGMRKMVCLFSRTRRRALSAPNKIGSTTARTRFSSGV